MPCPSSEVEASKWNGEILGVPMPSERNSPCFSTGRTAFPKPVCPNFQTAAPTNRGLQVEVDFLQDKLFLQEIEADGAVFDDNAVD